MKSKFTTNTIVSIKKERIKCKRFMDEINYPNIWIVYSETRDHYIIYNFINKKDVLAVREDDIIEISSLRNEKIDKILDISNI